MCCFGSRSRHCFLKSLLFIYLLFIFEVPCKYLNLHNHYYLFEHTLMLILFDFLCSSSRFIFLYLLESFSFVPYNCLVLVIDNCSGFVSYFFCKCLLFYVFETDSVKIASCCLPEISCCIHGLLLSIVLFCV